MKSLIFTDATIPHSPYDPSGRLTASAARLTQVRCDHPSLGQRIRREHHYRPGGQLSAISTAIGQWRYHSDEQQRLTQAQAPAAATEETYRYDRAGNRFFAAQRLSTEQDRWDELTRQNIDNPHFNFIRARATPAEHTPAFCWPDNRVLDNGHYWRKYDNWGNLIERYDEDRNEQHFYTWNVRQWLISHRVEIKDPEGQKGSEGQSTGRITHYSYDPLGRRISKRTQPLKNGQPAGEAEITYYGWDGERLVLTERGQQQIHTIYEPNSFIPMIRVEGAKGPATQTLAEKMQQQVQAKLTPDNVRVIDGIERELRQDSLTPQTQRYLIAARLSPLALLEMLDPEPDLKGKTIHYYHCDHLGTPLMLISQDGEIDWSAELDPWGKVMQEHNPKKLYQPIRMQGQHYDEESGLHYNRHRYYDPEIGSYISPDPIGLAGGLNPYAYADNNPIRFVDPVGLAAADRLSIEEMEGKIAANNHSGQSNNLILCMAWKESSFDPTAASTDPRSSATGLLEVTKTALRDVNSLTELGTFDISQMKDADQNLTAGTAYLGIVIKRYKNNPAIGLNHYGTGTGYSDNILDCEKCLNECASGSATCKNDGKQKCLNQIHK